MEHYVYLYRDENGRPRYVGYGKNVGRPESHLSGSHNPKLRAFLEAGKYTLEIAGPFGSEETGRAVETAVISSLKPEYNIDPGPAQWRFRPLGVPLVFSDRLDMPPLARADFQAMKNGDQCYPVLFVYIGSKNFEDGRLGHDPANPPSDPQILARIEKSWQLGRHIEKWIEKPAESPRLLVAVSGRPSARIVIAAVEIDPLRWKEMPREPGGLYQIPTQGPQNLDACGLRGRRVSESAGITFGGIRSGFFVILVRDEKAPSGSATS